MTRVGTRGIALVGPAVFLSEGGAWRAAISFGASFSTTFIAFATQDVWYAIHGNGLLGKTTSVYRTTDAGRHWRVVAELPSVAMGAQTVGTVTADGIMFSSAQDGLIWGGGAKGRPLLLTTSDGGHRWFPAAIDLAGRAVAGSISGYVVTPTFYGRQEAALVLAFGDAIQPAYLYVTDDGGRNWSLPRRFPGYLFSTTDGQHLYAAANNALWTSSDGGSHWQALRLTGGYSFDTLDFVGTERGFALIGRGHEVRLVETRDGGRTWTSP